MVIMMILLPVTRTCDYLLYLYIYTSIPMYSEHWYRVLSVLVWVLEAMRLDSPNHMFPFHKCWNRDRPVVDNSRGKRAYDMNQSQLSQWDKLRREKV